MYGTLKFVEHFCPDNPSLPFARFLVATLRASTTTNIPVIMPHRTASPGAGILRNKKRSNDPTLSGQFQPPPNPAAGGLSPGLPTGTARRPFRQGTAQANASVSTSGSGTAVSFSDSYSGPTAALLAAEGSFAMPGHVMAQASPLNPPHVYDSEEDLFATDEEE